MAESPASSVVGAQRPEAAAGLSSDEAARRQRRDGPNRLPQAERRHPAAIILSVLREPMLLLLLAATAIYLVLGDPGEAAVLGASVVLVIGLTVYQEQKSERALQALRDLSSPRARVLRDGAPVVIAGHDVVLGDIILVTEGDRVPADARLLAETDLHVDESMLTGESVPLRLEADDESGTDGGLLHASTLVVRGRGTAEVVAIGAATEVGRIGASMGSLRPEKSPLQMEMRSVVTVFAGISLASCALMTGLYLYTRGGWLDALLAGITLAMATIPEEFPVVLTVFLALGAWRMAQQNTLVRRAAAIEALGSITVLCTDKTGTLTRNHMALAELAGNGAQKTLAAPEASLRALLFAGLAASQPQSADPMERALREAARSRNMDDPGDALRHVREYPLSSQCPAVAHVWLGDAAEQFAVFCKGAPETVAGLCRLAPANLETALSNVDGMARRGLRVLGVASSEWPADRPGDLPVDLAGFRFQWLGLLGFADPLREGAREAVAEAQAAGIRVVMLTGDHVETARAIAHDAGIGRNPTVAVGLELDGMDDSQLDQFLAGVDVFARVRPEHKLRLVNALKGTGEIVAMTGDGVNDAPALIAAHVGIAMGSRGTDVAREASSIVLLDDDFVTVVKAVRRGRTIYDNIMRAVRYIMAVHIPITGLALLPMFTGGPLVLLPLHVVFLELIIDPACSIVFERERPAPDIMRRPPRTPGPHLLETRGLVRAITHGGFMLAIVVAIYLLGGAQGLPAAELGALAFTALVAGNLGLILLYRSGGSMWERLRQDNIAFWIVVSGATLMLVLVTQVALPASWFGFTRPPLLAWLLSAAAPLAGAIILDLLQRGRTGPEPPLV